MRLALEHLSKQFKNKIAVDNVNTVLKEGIYGFLGANGAGKTTLMQMVCGILAPTKGEVKVDGVNNIKMGEDFRDLLGYLPQEFGYMPGFTAKDFMLYIASIKGLMPGYAKRRTEELLELVNLESDMNRKIRTFSGGMKRRLGIAQALLNDPKILIMDEPTAGLDPKERAYFRNV
ncbi:ATP-binding cassette domain-containing protein, partial [Mediterraneibacter glycyrrhizinilyticus]